MRKKEDEKKRERWKEKNERKKSTEDGKRI